MSEAKLVPTIIISLSISFTLLNNIFN
jgi:hypothetical protein